MPGETEIAIPQAPPVRSPLLVIAIIILALTNLPYLWAEIMTPEGGFDVGFVYYYQFEDACSYLAKMRLGEEGRWLYENRYTTEPHRPVVLFVFYTLLGHLSRLSGLGLVAAYHLARVLAAAGLLYALARLLRAMKLSEPARVLAFLCAAAAQGFGWTYILPGDRAAPLEYWMTEAFTLQTMMHHPHLIVATLCLLLGWTDLMRFALGESGLAALARIAAASFALGWTHPRILLPFLLVGGTAGLLCAARGQASIRRFALGLGVALLAGAPPGAWMYFSVRSEPLIAQWAETATPSPDIRYVLFSYGLLWPLALAGARHAWKTRSPWGAFLVAWFALGAVAPYLPLISQRRMILGFNIPLGILSGWQLADVALAWARGLAPRGPRAIAFAALAVLCGSLFLSPMVYIWVGARQSLKRFYLPYAAIERDRSFSELRRRAKPGDVALASRMSGILLPAFSGARVISGHWAETLDDGAKLAQVREFFQPNTPRERRIEIIRRHDVKFLYRTPWEAELGAYNPAADPALWRPIWSEGAYSLFALAPGINPPTAAAPADASAPEPTPGTVRP